VTMRRIRFSVQATLESAQRWSELAYRVERLGFHALMAADHPGVTASPFAALAAAAAVTSTLQLGTYVCNVGIRDPLAIASDAATVDVLSGGRVTFGVGAGHPRRMDHDGTPLPRSGGAGRTAQRDRPSRDATPFG